MRMKDEKAARQVERAGIGNAGKGLCDWQGDKCQGLFEDDQVKEKAAANSQGKAGQGLAVAAFAGEGEVPVQRVAEQSANQIASNVCDDRGNSESIVKKHDCAIANGGVGYTNH